MEQKMTTIESIINENNYFTTSWNQNIICDIESVQDIFKMKGSSIINDVNESYQILNNNYEGMHNQYANNIQLYYSLLSKKTDSSIETDFIPLRKLTPVLIQRTDNILNVLLYMMLDQNHDFRGPRTTGTDSWVSIKKPTLITKNKFTETNNVIPDPFDNSYQSILVNTTFSGLKSIIGLIVMDDESDELLKANPLYYNNNTLNIHDLMTLFNIKYDIADGYILMNGASTDGNIIKIGDAKVTFLSFAQSTWDSGMHCIWDFDLTKNIYLVKLNQLTNDNGIINPEYSCYFYSKIEYVIPKYECLYNTNAKVNNSFVNCISNLGYGFKVEQLTDELLSKYYDKLLQFFQLPQVTCSQSESVIENPSYINNFRRGVAYRLIGLAGDNDGYKRLFYELCKNIRKNMDDSIDNLYTVPKCITHNCIAKEQEDIEVDFYENIEDLKINHPTETIQKQFGTVNDMNLAGLELNPIIKMLNIPLSQESDFSPYKSTSSTSSASASASSSSTSSLSTATTVESMSSEVASAKKSSASTSAMEISKGNCSSEPIKTKDCSLFNKTIINSTNPSCIEEMYPLKFQITSGVIDSSKLGGQNMAQYFAPDIDINMTIFDNKTGFLIGAIIRMTFVKKVETNIIDTKNNADVYSHFVFVDFDEIEFNCDELTGKEKMDEWKNDCKYYSIALRQLIRYAANNIFYVTNSENNNLTHFIIKLKDGSFKNLYYFMTNSEGPSVKIMNSIISNITKKLFDWVTDDKIDSYTSIVRVAQRIYSESLKLQSILEPNLDIQEANKKRNTNFEAIFFLRIKYVGDKSRCTDSLFLNVNPYIEPLLVTGDANAFSSALMFGSSSLFSTPTSSFLYFAPYVTPENKQLVRVSDTDNYNFKLDLFKGVSPHESLKSGESKIKKNVSQSYIIKSQLFKNIMDNERVCEQIFTKEIKKSLKPIDDIACSPFVSMYLLNGDIISGNSEKTMQTIIINKLEPIYSLYDDIDVLQKLLVPFNKGVSQYESEKLIPKNIFGMTGISTIDCDEIKFFERMDLELAKNKLDDLKNFIADYYMIGEISCKLKGGYEKSLIDYTGMIMIPFIFRCFITGLKTLAIECRKHETNYNGNFKKNEIVSTYKILADNLAILSGDDEDAREKFIEETSKIKLEIIDDLIREYISFVNDKIMNSEINNKLKQLKDETPKVANTKVSNPNLANKSKIQFVEIILEMPNKLSEILNKDIPSKIKVDNFSHYLNENNEIYNRLNQKDKQFIDPLMPILPTDFFEALELLHLINDYNNNFTNIVFALGNFANYNNTIENIKTFLSNVDNLNNIKKSCSTYKNLESFYKRSLSCLEIKQVSSSSKKGRRITTTTVKIPPKEEIPVIKEMPRETKTRRKIETTSVKIPQEENYFNDMPQDDYFSNEPPIKKEEIEIPAEVKTRRKILTGRQTVKGGDKDNNSIIPSKENDEIRYLNNKKHIINNFIEIIEYYSSPDFSKLINGNIINYENVLNINSYLTAILLIDINKNLSFYKIPNILDLITEIKKNTENEKDNLNYILSIRSYYNMYFEKYIIIDNIQHEYMQCILGYYEVDLKEKLDSNIIQPNKTVELLNNFKKLINYNYYILAFIYDRLTFIGTIDDKAISNYATIYCLFEELDNVYLGNIHETSDNYEIFIYLCVFLIKYSNDLIKYISNNKLSFQENGVLNDYSEIKLLLDSANLSQYYDSTMKLKIIMNEKPSLSDINNYDNLSSASQMFTRILLNMEDVKLEDVKLEDVKLEGVKPEYRKLQPTFISKINYTEQPIKYRETSLNKIIAAGGGTVKYRKYNNKKTKNNKQFNRKRTIKLLFKKNKKYSRKHK